MNNADIAKKLRGVFKVITDEAAKNEQFAANIAAARASTSTGMRTVVTADFFMLSLYLFY